MDQTSEATGWISAYFEWSGVEWREAVPGSPTHRAMAGPGAVAAVDFPSAYLEWLDGNPPAPEQRRQSRNSMPGRRAADVFGGATAFREAVLLAALHTESDCLHVVRQALEGAVTNQGTVRLAVEALEHAHRLLDDERSAWHALSALHGNGLRRSSDAWRIGLESEWPHALEDVAADVRALTGKVLALPLH